MSYAPQDNSNDRHYANEILHTCEFVLHGPYGHDRSALSGLEGDE